MTPGQKLAQINSQWKNGLLIRDEVKRQAELGWILNKIGNYHRLYHSKNNPKKRKGIFDALPNPNPLDPTSTFYAETISGWMESLSFDYPQSSPTQNKYLGSGYNPLVGQLYEANFGIITIRPNANGYYQQWEGQVPLLIGQHWDKVDDTGLGDDDTTYVYDSVIGLSDKETYELESVPASGYTWQYIVVTNNLKVADGYRRIRNMIRINSTDDKGNPINFPETIYMYTSDTWLTNPLTGSRFTSDEINSLQAGIEAGIGTATQIRNTQCYVDCWYGRYTILRGFNSFDTSPLGASATVTSATLSEAIRADNSDTDFDLHFYSGQDQWTGTGDLDWGDCLTDEGVFFNTLGKALDTYYDHAVLTGSINKTGKTQFRLKSDREGTEPTGLENVMLYGSNTTYKPKLEVVYTVPAVAPKAGLNIPQALAILLGEES